MGRIVDFDCAPGTAFPQTIQWDAQNDVFPVAASNKITHLTIEVFNLDGDIDFTGQLPTNFCGAARVTIRKIDSSNGKILYSDGTIDYKFINKKGEYIELHFVNNQFII